MTAAGIDLTMARREAESEMRATCRISRPGEDVWNADTYQYDPGEQVVAYAGKCKLRIGATRVRRAEAASQLFAEQSATLAVPVEVGGIRKDDRVEILTSPDDPEMVGMIVWIDANRAMSNSTSRRFPVREVQ